MDLMIIRHAIARERAAFALTRRADAERPLTADGRRKFKRSLRVLRRAVARVDVFGTSPFVRAQETCALAAKAFKQKSVEVVPGLAHRGDDRAVIRWLAKQKPTATVAIVGHEPDLGRLTALLLGAGAPVVRYRKGGASLVLFEGRAAGGRGTLAWLLSPALMKRLR